MIKSYEDAVMKIAQYRFDADMGGSTMGYNGADVELVSYIYGVSKDQVYNDVSEGREKIQKTYIDQFNFLSKKIG